MQLEQFDDAFRRAWVTLSRKNQGPVFPCMIFHRGKPELHDAEKECQVKQQEMLNAIICLKRSSNSLSIKHKFLITLCCKILTSYYEEYIG
jgi:hypothetical protein